MLENFTQLVDAANQLQPAINRGVPPTVSSCWGPENTGGPGEQGESEASRTGRMINAAEGGGDKEQSLPAAAESLSLQQLKFSRRERERNQLSVTAGRYTQGIVLVFLLPPHQSSSLSGPHPILHALWTPLCLGPPQRTGDKAWRE